MFHVKKVIVSIKRDVMCTITKPVYEHEVEVLEAMHGDGAVSVVEPSEFDTLNHHLERPIYKAGSAPGTPPIKWSTTWPIDVGDEYSRLAQVYGTMENSPESYVEHVFGSVKRNRLEKEYRVTPDPGRPNEQLENAAAAPAAEESHTAARAGQNVAGAGESRPPPAVDEIPAEILGLDVGELKARLDELGVEYKSKHRKGDLQKLLAGAMAADDTPGEIMDEVRQELERLGIEVDDDMTPDELRDLLEAAKAEDDDKAA